jgi:hypothetical protein
MHTTIAVVFLILFAQQELSRPLPDNPCDVLTAAELAEVTGLEVTSIRRGPSIHEMVSAQRQVREPEPGTICSFETRSPFGALSIAVPPRSERSSVLYWEARSKYFETFPGSAQQIQGLGIDAWIGGGASLRVLVRENEFLMLSTQIYQRQSRELLLQVARSILQKYARSAI